MLSSMRWFNWDAPRLSILGRNVWFWVLFNRHSTEGHWWGVGILQVGRRHLLFVGHCGIRALFIGQTP